MIDDYYILSVLYNTHKNNSKHIFPLAHAIMRIPDTKII